MRIVNRTKVEQTFNGVTIAAGASYTSDPLDHDHDGRKGGSVSAEGDKDALAKLRAEYQELLGKRPFNGWDAVELQRRIDEALEA